MNHRKSKISCLQRKRGTKVWCVAGILLAMLPAPSGCRKVDPYASGSLEDCSSWDRKVADGHESIYTGVDIIVSVSTSSSMVEEQRSLATGLYTLVGLLTDPRSHDSASGFGIATVPSLRIAVVSADIGLEWGEAEDGYGGNTGGNTVEVPGCGDVGRDGAFLTPAAASVILESGRIPCAAGKETCPPGFDCVDRRCVGQEDVEPVACPSLNGEYAEGSREESIRDTATWAACTLGVDEGACTVTQPLEAALRGLRTHREDSPSDSFLVDYHMLAVLVVSDDEDCSIRDSGLFNTETWMSGADALLPVACHHPVENETFLFPADFGDAAEISDQHGVDLGDLSTYYIRFINMKDGKASAVIFGAIVGVPLRVGCEGDGVQLADSACLDREAMEMRVDTSVDPSTGQERTDWMPACTRNDEGGEEITRASPGRRFVKVAEEFGRNGFVSSICNDDWTGAMGDFANIIFRQFAMGCFDSRMGFEPRPAEGCPGCGVPTCGAEVKIHRSWNEKDDHSCPEALYAGLPPSDAEALRDGVSVEIVRGDRGEHQETIVRCPLPNLPLPLDCKEAAVHLDHARAGWYYCEKQGENFDDACSDGLDNDDDVGNGIVSDPERYIDCEDADCRDCPVCGGTGLNCESGCRFTVGITERTRSILSDPQYGPSWWSPEFRCVEESRSNVGSCQSPGGRSLGASCEPSDPVVEDPWRPFSLGAVRMSFLQGCDCLSYASYTYDTGEGSAWHLDHFCTRPCKEDCPDGFDCVPLFTDADPLPKQAANAYCVPTCLEKRCFGKGDGDIPPVCAPTNESGRVWACVSPEA